MLEDEKETNQSTLKNSLTSPLVITNATIAAFLRVIYASIVNSPVLKYKQRIIAQLYDITNFKQITLL